MNNIKKIGLTALAGSLVTLGSAQAGDISVSGSINATLKFGKGGENTTRSSVLTEMLRSVVVVS